MATDAEIQEWITDPDLWKEALDMACDEGVLGQFTGPVSPYKIRDMMFEYFKSLQAGRGSDTGLAINPE